MACSHRNVLIEQHCAALLEVCGLHEMVAVHHLDDVFPRHLGRARHVRIDLVQNDVVEVGRLAVQLAFAPHTVANVHDRLACNVQMSASCIESQCLCA